MITTQQEAEGMARKLYPTVPLEIVDGLFRYAFQRIPPGSFLRGVLENDLIVAVTHAHPCSMANLSDIVGLCLSTLPTDAWGSEAKVAAYLANKPDQQRPTGFAEDI